MLLYRACQSPEQGFAEIQLQFESVKIQILVLDGKAQNRGLLLTGQLWLGTGAGLARRILPIPGL